MTIEDSQALSFVHYFPTKYILSTPIAKKKIGYTSKWIAIGEIALYAAAVDSNSLLQQTHVWIEFVKQLQWQKKCMYMLYSTWRTFTFMWNIRGKKCTHHLVCALSAEWKKNERENARQLIVNTLPQRKPMTWRINQLFHPFLFVCPACVCPQVYTAYSFMCAVRNILGAFLQPETTRKTRELERQITRRVRWAVCMRWRYFYLHAVAHISEWTKTYYIHTHMLVVTCVCVCYCV